MPKLNPVQTNFTSGEISPKLMGRIDYKGYTNGAQTIENGVVLVEGGIQRRPGLRYVGPCNASTTDVRLIPYVFSQDSTYVIELGDAYMRFITESGIVTSGSAPLVLASPYAASEVFDLEYVQSSSSINFAHMSHAIQRLYPVSAASWIISTAPFDPNPFSEIGNRPAGTLTLSSVDSVILATSSVSAFSPHDVGRHISAGPGLAIITGYGSDTSVALLSIADFSSTTFAANEWTITESPQTPILASAVGPSQASITITALGPEFLATELFQEGTTLTVTTASAHGLAVDDYAVLSGFESTDLDGKYTVTSVPSDTEFKVECGTTVLISAAFGRIYKFGAGSAFASSDGSRYIRLNSGLAIITGFTDASSVTAKVLTILTSTAVAAAGGWSLEDIEWNAIDGYPRSISLFQQRLIAAGTASKPQGIWGSATGSYYDMQLGTSDADAFSFVAASDQVNPILHMTAAKVLGVFTEGGEFVVDAGSTKTAITATAIDVTSQSTYGSAQVRPVRVGNEILYVQRGAKKVLSLNYDLNSDSFVSTDLTAAAEHVTLTGIVDCAFQQLPTPTLWLVRTDGVLISMTYQPTQSVVAFTRHTTDGYFRSVACIPGSDSDVGDLVFFVVERVINGATVRNIERFDADLNTDSAITGTSDTAINVWTGFASLEGKSVDVKADGTYVGTYTVSGGSITLANARTANAIEVGLHYETNIVLLPPVINGATGVSIGSAESTNQFILRVLETIGGTVNGQEIPWREFGTGILDESPQPFTGDKDVSDIGWGSEQAVTITQDQPYDFHLLAVIRAFTTNQG